MRHVAKALSLGWVVVSFLACGADDSRASRTVLVGGETGTASEDGFDVRLSADTASLSTPTGQSVIGRAYVEFLGNQLREVEIRINPRDIPEGVVLQLMPAVLSDSGYVVFSLLPQEGVPAQTTTLALEASFGRTVRAVPFTFAVEAP